MQNGFACKLLKDKLNFDWSALEGDFRTLLASRAAIGPEIAM